MGYRLLDHTADIGVEIFAASLDELFAEALAAFTDSMTELERVEERISRRWEVRAEGLDLLLVEWLNEALYAFEVDGLLLRRARVKVETTEDGTRLAGEVWGEAYDPERHPIKVLIKGVTYHGLEVNPTGNGWRAQVILDI